MRKHRCSLFAIGIHVLSLPARTAVPRGNAIFGHGTKTSSRSACKKKKKKWKERADVRALTYGLTLATNGTINRACQRVWKTTAMYIF